MNISRNHSKSLNLPDLQETVSNLRECIFHDFDILEKMDARGKYLIYGMSSIPCTQTTSLNSTGYNSHCLTFGRSRIKPQLTQS